MLQPKRDPQIDSALRKALAGRVTKDSGDCPDENMVTMYLESRLDPAQRANYEGHVSSCSGCRQVLALAMKLNAADENNPGAAVSAGRAQLFFRYRVGWPAVAMVLLAIGVVVFYQTKGPRKDSEIAEYKLPASAQSPVDRAARSEEPSPAVVGLNQGASEPTKSSAASRNAAPVTKSLSGTSAQVVKTRDERVPSAAALPAPSPGVAGSSAESQPADSAKNARAGSASSMVRQSDSVTLDAGARGIVGGTLSQPSGLESPQTVLVAFSERFLSDQVYASPLRLQDPSRSAPALKAAQTAKTDSAQEARVTSKMEEPELRLTRKQIGDKVFYLVSGYWIDGECGKHPREGIVEISEGDGVWEQIRGAFPGLTALRSTKATVLIHWNGMNYAVKESSKQ